MSAPDETNADPGRAVALNYESDTDEAPRVVAKGEGELAARIVELARDHGIPVRSDADLASLLTVVELEHTIPIEAFEAVARILAHIYQANGRLPETSDQDQR